MIWVVSHTLSQIVFSFGNEYSYNYHLITFNGQLEIGNGNGNIGKGHSNFSRASPKSGYPVEVWENHQNLFFSLGQLLAVQSEKLNSPRNSNIGTRAISTSPNLTP